METNYRLHFFKYSLLSFFSLIVYPLFFYFLCKIALYFINFHSWPLWYLGLPLTWIIVTTAFHLIRGKNGDKYLGYKKISSNVQQAELSIDEIEAKKKLDRVLSVVYKKLGINFNLTYYIYLNNYKAISLNHKYRVVVNLAGKKKGLYISKWLLTELSDEELMGVLAHEVGHLISSKWTTWIQVILKLTSIPRNALTIFISMSIGLINWWLFFPALILVGYISIMTTGLPLLILEVACDKFAVNIGHGKSLRYFLSELPGDFKVPDGIHLYPNTRIKLIKKWEEE